MLKKIFSISMICTLSACNIPDRLSRVGSAPELNEIEPVEQDVTNEYPTTDGMQTTELAERTPNSLWKPGSRSFFRDQRARSVGDILKVIVTIKDNAKMDNKTETKRTEDGAAGIPHIMGVEAQFGKILPKGFDPTNLISTNSTDNNKGEGKIDRKEDIKTTVAATVVKILPSNNLRIRGSQEIRVNNELREVTVEGIVRPEDISAQNSVTLDQIAEARVSYGGRGNVSDLQQPRYGKQVLDIISPF